MSNIGTMYTLNPTVGAVTSNEEKARLLDELVSKGEIVDYSREKKFGMPGGPAEIVISDKYIVLASDETTALGIGDGSIMMAGKVHMAKSPSDIRINGYWVFNEELLTTVPSTLACPIQTLIYKAPPYAQKISKFRKLMTLFGI